MGAILVMDETPAEASRLVAEAIDRGITYFDVALKPWSSRRYPLLGHWWPNLVINPLIVPLARRRGQVYCPLDPTPEPRLRFYLWLGVDGLLSDDPRTTRAALERVKRN